MNKISSSLMASLREWLMEYSGIVLERIGNRNILEDKIRQHMESVGAQTEADYMMLLGSNCCNSIRDDLISKITVNESFFFRNPDQFRYILDKLLPEIADERKNLDMGPIDIWSAGCSTGEEALSMAIIVKNFFQTNKDVKINLYASDVNSSVVQFASRGRFRNRSVRPAVWEPMKRYAYGFVERDAEGITVSQEILSLVNFKVGNLKNFDDLKCHAGSDIILCRNVLIYFEEEFRKRLVEKLHSLLKPGGMLFVGEAESISDYRDYFDLVNCYGAYGYRKIPGRE